MQISKSLKKLRTALFEGSFYIFISAFALFAGSLYGQSSSSKMVLIPAKDSTFQMGSVNGNEDEKPVHAVIFTYNFWMDKTEITQADYDSLMSASYSGYNQPSWGSPYGVGDNYPVYAIEWDDAALYCNALSRKEGLDSVYSYTSISGHPGDGCQLVGLTINYEADGYRLPTEAEWEYACRAGSTTDFFWGKDYGSYPASAADTSEVSGYAVWSANSWALSAESSDYGTHPVAGKEPNAFGLYDMAGNVYEWINDWFTEYTSEAQTDPTGTEEETYRFVRGGSWGNSADYLRSSNRQFSSPDYYIYFCGFRTVRPAQPSEISVESETTETPAEFSLYQNYPNPFNPGTVIKFDLPKSANVTLSIYNMLGEKITELISGETLSAGTHSARFNAAGLSSGIYFYRIEAGNIVQTRKMLLLR
jgi:formylglycine-generating enzyme required for sulfatase activity